jgi:GAF domain-containing protein
LASVIKASNAISSEIELNALLKTLISVLVENAGADKGILIIRNRELNRWQIEAEMSKDKVRVNLSVPLVKGAEISLSKYPINVIEYVAQTSESLVLDHASVKGSFVEDSYVKSHNIRSVLCVPLISQGKMIAIIYLVTMTIKVTHFDVLGK